MIVIIITVIDPVVRMVIGVIHNTHVAVEMIRMRARAVVMTGT